MSDHVVTFAGRGECRVPDKTRLLDAVTMAGIRLGGLCGGMGSCGRCRMNVISGRVRESSFPGISDSETASGAVLSCLTTVREDLEVEIPADAPILPGDARHADAAALDEQSAAVFGRAQDGGTYAGAVSARPKAAVMALAVDVGTTTVEAELLDLSARRVLGRAVRFNSQAPFGRDVVSRIMASEKCGVAPLQEAVIGDINSLAKVLADRAGMSAESVGAVVCAGNTVMTHFLMGMRADSIRRRPYTPVSLEPPPVEAGRIGLRLAPGTMLSAVPCISGWVGGDLVAGILATGMHEDEGPSLLVDMGTNGEIIAGGSDWLAATSASAGPALEGAGVECGMAAEEGAVEAVSWKSGRVELSTIGGGSPRGICGSGIIGLVALLLKHGIIDRQGKITASGPRVRESHGLRRYVLADNGETASGAELFIGESDLENVISAKAAIFAAISILCRRLELPFQKIRRIRLAGAFGRHLDLESAVAIGLVPDVPRERVSFEGNTSLLGAAMAAADRSLGLRLSEISGRTTHFDLMGEDSYVDEFRQAMFLPHTDLHLFPSVLPVGGRS